MLFGRGEFTVGQLRSVLDGLQQFAAAAGAKTAAADFKVFADMLEPFGSQGVSAFCDAMKTKLAAAAEKPKTKKKPSAKPKAAASEATTRQYIAELQQAGTDRPSFEAVFGRLAADKSLKSADVGEIARQYANSVTKYKSIAAARDDIEKAFVRNARFENKLR
jgi:hypothetical protein